VTPGAAGDRGGLREGDWILRWGRIDASDRGALVRAIAQTPLGSVVRVEGLRAGRAVAFDVAPARRAREDRSPSVASTCHLPGDGTVVLASRFGLARVDLESGAATPLWRSRVPGDIDETTGFAGVVYAVVGTSPLGDSTVVAVDERSGVERWATALEGRVLAAPRIVGSALVLDTREPTRTWILDRATGSVRASHERSTSYRAAFGFVGGGYASDGGESVDAGGTVFLWRDGARGPWLTGVDPATGVASWHHTPDVSSGGRLFGLPLAGGGLVATAAVDEAIDVFLPDLRGGVEPFGSLRIDGPRFGSSRWGVLTSDARLAVGGDVVYVARISRDVVATAGSVEIDRRAARGISVQDPANWRPPSEPLLRPNSATTVQDRNDAWPTLASFRATLDGAWACATTWRPSAEAAAGRAVFIAPSVEGPDGFVAVATQSSILYARGPLLAGAWVLVPTDGGYLILRRRAMEAR